MKQNPFRSAACGNKAQCPYQNQGGILTTDDQFCSICGADLKEVTTAAPTRIKWSNILIGVILLGVIALLLFKFCATNAPSTPVQDPSNAISTPPAPAPDNNTGSPEPPSPSAFTYTAPAPVNGFLRGVIALGAQEFGFFAIRMDSQKRWKQEKAVFGASLAYENLITEQDIREGIKTHITNMTSFGVPPTDVHFMVSSGARKEEKVQQIMTVLKDMGYYVNVVTAEQEGVYGFKTAVPPPYRNKAFMVDIGSSNTKISWMTDAKIIGKEAPGAKYFQKGIADADVFGSTTAIANQVPANVRTTCFIIGGVPFDFAKKVRKDKERYTVIPAPEAITADGDKQKCGLNIYKAIAQATGCKQFVFDWEANYTEGFLLDLQ